MIAKILNINLTYDNLNVIEFVCVFVIYEEIKFFCNVLQL